MNVKVLNTTDETVRTVGIMLDVEDAPAIRRRTITIRPETIRITWKSIDGGPFGIRRAEIFGRRIRQDGSLSAEHSQMASSYSLRGDSAVVTGDLPEELRQAILDTKPVK